MSLGQNQLQKPIVLDVPEATNQPDLHHTADEAPLVDVDLPAPMDMECTEAKVIEMEHRDMKLRLLTVPRECAGPRRLGASRFLLLTPTNLGNQRCRRVWLSARLLLARMNHAEPSPRILINPRSWRRRRRASSSAKLQLAKNIN